MTVQSSPRTDEKQTPPSRARISANKIAAVAAWLIGTFTTWLFIRAASPEVATAATVVTAFLFQGLLTLAERPLFRRLRRRSGGTASALSVICLLLDTLINAAGVYPYTHRLDATGVGVMLADVLKVQATVNSTSAFFIAGVAGFILAGLPELLWESD